MGARGTEPGEQRIRSAALQPLGPSGAQQAASPRVGGWELSATDTTRMLSAPPLGGPRQIHPQSSLLA